MFSYLMAPFKHLPVEVLSIKGPEQSLHLPDNRLMKEFLKKHFPKAEYTVLKGDPEEQIAGHLQHQENALVVLGAYQRSKVSRWFRPSMVDALMRHVKLPLFVVHHK
jgi:nucleotide-binding universal stress UspA family protein